MMIEDYRSHNKLLQENLDDCKYQLKKALNDSDRGRGGDTEKKKGRIIQGIFSPKTVNEKNKNMLHYFGKVITLPYKLPQYKK